MEEKTKTIYFTDDSNTGMVYPEMPDDVPCEGFAESSSGVIVFLIVCLFILAVFASLFCITYYK